jgi:GT2 family glycosyltransferase
MSASTSDVLIFLDDDFLPAEDFVTEVERLFSSDPTIVAATGSVLADGILSEGIEYEEGRRIVKSAGLNDGGAPFDVFNAYGCNMVIRMAPVRQHALRFDEALPLYGWLEDVDFCRQLAPYGRIVKSPRLRGVHLGTKKAGRSPGVRLGYSQVANPAYLARKGSISWPRALKSISRNFAANMLRSAGPEPWVDRRGRLKGNLKAATDAVIGKLHPQRILSFK